MSHIAFILLRLSLLVALVLPLGVEPAASAQAPQQAVPVSCLAVPILGKIIGTVRDSDDQPLAGVTVTAHTTTGATTASGSTNAAGAYGIPLPPGAYLVEFKPPSGLLQAIWYTGGTSPLDATLVEVEDGKTVSGIDVKLPVGAQFTVTLRDPEGQPVDQGLVSVFDRDGRKVAEGQTDEEGRALTAPGLAPGGYRLFALPPSGSPLLAQYHAQQPALDTADPLTITQALNNVETPMTLQRGAQLSGTVADAATGTPLAGIRVEVRNPQGEARHAMTDTQGRYSIEGLPSGSYQVVFNSGQPEPAHAPLRRLVALSAPNAQTEFDATLAQGGAISGRVSAPDGSPIPDVSIQVRDLDGAIDSHGSSAADGSYIIHGLPSGRYRIAYAGYNLQALALADPVTVIAPDTTTVAATVLSPGGAISGIVTDPDDEPVEGVYVSILDAATGSLQKGSSYTNADGVYTTPTTLASGSYIVKFQPPVGAKACPLAIEYSGNAATAAAATRVQVSAPNAVTGIDAKLDYGGHITGQITDAANGLPLFGTVQVYDATGVVVAAASTTGVAGSYRTAVGLPLGAYRVQFSADGYLPLFYGGATRLEAAAPVPSGASDVSMALQRGGTLTGRITAADSGAPLEHAAVTLYDVRDRVVATQLTTFDGSYRFAGDLPSGVYRVGVAPGQRADGTPYFTGYAVIFSGGASSLAQAQPISLVASKTLSADLAMPKTTDTPPTPQPEPSPPAQRVYLPLLRR